MTRARRVDMSKFAGGRMGSMNAVIASTLVFVASIMLLLIFFKTGKSKKATKSPRLFQSPEQIPPQLLSKFDAVLVLGGGVPVSPDEPPIYVQRRLDDVAQVYAARRLMSRKTERDLPVLCLSAGTAHLPQLIGKDGLPIWESTASAAYLKKKHGLTSIYVETTSYDTIGNAFYARTCHTDIVGWRKLLIVTNEFHMPRTIEIFKWIFGLDKANYELYFLQSPNVGLSAEAIEARLEKERKSLATVQLFSCQYRSMRTIWKFLTQEHALYTAEKLVERASSQDSNISEEVKRSYGGELR